MAKGKKTGGRTAGTPNRNTAELTARLEELKCDPLELSAKIALGQELDGPHPQLRAFYKLLDQLDKALEDGAVPDNARESSANLRSLVDQHLTKGYVPPELRSKHIVDLMKYVYPQRKAIEVTGKDGDDLPPLLDASNLSTDTLREIVTAMTGSKPADK